MILTKTDFDQQALVVDQTEKDVIENALDLMLNSSGISAQRIFIANRLKKFLETSSNNEDRPALFQKSHGNMINCPDCQGTGFEKYAPDDRNEEPDYPHCKTCKGEGQLYLEVIRKSYIPTEYLRKKLAK
jgi:hypothetical protein